MRKGFVMSTFHHLLVGLGVLLVVTAGLCVLDNDHAGIDLCFTVLAVTLQTWGLLSPAPMGRVVPSEIPHATIVPLRPSRPPI